VARSIKEGAINIILATYSTLTDAAYSLMFAYAASHSLPARSVRGLRCAFRRAGFRYSHHGLLVRQLRRRCNPLLDRAAFWHPLARVKLERAVQTASRLADRHYVWMILFHRYPHGIRGVAGFAYGISQLPWPTFLALNFAAAGLWSCAIVSAGYAFGQVSEKVMSDASSGLGFVMLVAFLGLSWILRKKLERVVERN
jgi:hypothetical protein